MNVPVTIFYSYAHADELLRQELEKHLSSFRQQGLISEWHDRQILAGTDWKGALDKHLNAASVILLLISPDFLASDYCYGIEMQCALERHDKGSACIIPIMLRPVDLQGVPLAHLQWLPRDAVIESLLPEVATPSSQRKGPDVDLQSPALSTLIAHQTESKLEIVQNVKKGEDDIIGVEAENVKSGTIKVNQAIYEAKKKIIGIKVDTVG